MRFEGRIEGVRRKKVQLRNLKRAERDEIAKAVKRSTVEVKRVAKVLAPNVTGETRDRIEHEIREGGMTGIVFVEVEDRKDKDKVYSIHWGRKKGVRGTTDPKPYMHRAGVYIAKKHRGRVRRALNKAVKKVMGNG